MNVITSVIADHFRDRGRDFGREMRRAYTEEFAETPRRETVGDWDSAALASAPVEDRGLEPDDWIPYTEGFYEAFYGE